MFWVKIMNGIVFESFDDIRLADLPCVNPPPHAC